MGLFGPRYADGQVVDLGGLPIRLRVSGRARRVSLRVDRARGEAVAVAPSVRLLTDAVAFARARRDWLAERLAETRPPPSPLSEGEHLVVFGVPWRLQPDGRRPRLAPDLGEGERRLLGCGQDRVDAQLVSRVVRREAAEVFRARAEIHCAALGVPTPPVLLTDTRSRWGSCAPPRPGRPATIRLSWRLALAPFDVADYVVAHECAHLREANHGPRFWALVRALVGSEKAHRAWLRAEGQTLHAILPRAGA